MATSGVWRGDKYKENGFKCDKCRSYFVNEYCLKKHFKSQLHKMISIKFEDIVSKLDADEDFDIDVSDYSVDSLADDDFVTRQVDADHELINLTHSLQDDLNVFKAEEEDFD